MEKGMKSSLLSQAVKALQKESASNVMNRTVLHQHKPEVNVLGMEEVKKKIVYIQDLQIRHKESEGNA